MNRPTSLGFSHNHNYNYNLYPTSLRVVPLVAQVLASFNRKTSCFWWCYFLPLVYFCFYIWLLFYQLTTYTITTFCSSVHLLFVGVVFSSTTLARAKVELQTKARFECNLRLPWRCHRALPSCRLAFIEPFRNLSLLLLPKPFPRLRHLSSYLTKQASCQLVGLLAQVLYQGVE